MENHQNLYLTHTHKEECFQKYNVCGLYDQEDEVGNIEDENIKTLLTLRPMNLVHYFQYLVHGTENVEAGARKFIQNNNKVPSLLNRRWGKKDVRSITTTTCNHNIHICAGCLYMYHRSVCMSVYTFQKKFISSLLKLIWT